MARARQSIRPLVVDDTFVEQDLSDSQIALMDALSPGWRRPPESRSGSISPPYPTYHASRSASISFPDIKRGQIRKAQDEAKKLAQIQMISSDIIKLERDITLFDEYELQQQAHKVLLKLYPLLISWYDECSWQGRKKYPVCKELREILSKYKIVDVSFQKTFDSFRKKEYEIIYKNIVGTVYMNKLAIDSERGKGCAHHGPSDDVNSKFLTGAFDDKEPITIVEIQKKLEEKRK